MYEDGWCTIESDPGVFTELLKEVGVKDVQVEELFALDPESLKGLGKVFGIIFLFKWKMPDNEKDKMDMCVPGEASDTPIYFAKQVINNACATQAILSIVLNSPEIDIGDELREFKKNTAEFDPAMKGLAISNLAKVRTAHNSFAPSHQFVIEQERTAEKEDDVYHFVSYVPWNGGIFELDGTRPGPIRRGDANEHWVDECIPIIRQRMDEYSTNEIRFNLMAVVKNRELMYQTELDEVQEKLSRVREMESVDKEEEGKLTSEVAILEVKIAEERLKHMHWQKENTRRKHNYIPFVMEFLKLLASKGELNKMIEAAKEERRKKQASPS